MNLIEQVISAAAYASKEDASKIVVSPEIFQELIKLNIPLMNLETNTFSIFELELVMSDDEILYDIIY